MTATPLWEPSGERLGNSRMQAFLHEVNSSRGLALADYEALRTWSVASPEDFWETLWRFCDVRASQGWNAVLTGGERFASARWFSGAKLNFAENLLRERSSRTAIVSCLENGAREVLSHDELHGAVARVAATLRERGIGPGDCVAGFMPNIAATVVAMLASTSIGASWTSCSPDFGASGVIDRFGQTRPKVLFCCDGYYYNGKTIDVVATVKALTTTIDSIQTLVVVPVIDAAAWDLAGVTTVNYRSILEQALEPELVFEQLPFDHPLYIMYSSGTTGAPKCIVHGAGGTLLQHLKEHRLHTDLGPDDRLLYFTTCGWMMWNWMTSALASGTALVLYDGSPFYPGPEALLDLLDREQVSVFGTSAKYIAALEKHGVRPRESHKLAALKTILSTGSPLSPGSFEYVYRDVKDDICLSSISGGTDIISCFVLGNPCLPVWAGEIQCRGLGMAVEIWDDAGKSVTGEKGNLVCTRPFPSAPICFWNDPDRATYEKSYFELFPDIWAQGDYGEITEHGGVIIYGRSDATLNPGGVRIGTAEIYRQVETLEEVVDQVCVGQPWEDDVRVVLFLVLRGGVQLTAELEDRIRKTIRAQTTPRHVPAKIIAVPDIPRTLSGKISEIAVLKTITNRAVDNTGSLANPQALEHFRNLAALAI